MNTVKQVVFWTFLLISGIFSKIHVAKRSLLFPKSTVLQFTCGVSAPVIFPKRSINFSLCIQSNYELPFNISHWYPTVVSGRSSKEDYYEYDIDRLTFYKYISSTLDGLGLNGEDCLLRSICEIADIPMNIEEPDSLLENIVHYMFTPSADSINTNLVDNSTYNNLYLQAEMLGKSNGKCQELYSQCQLSIVNLFTKIFLV